MKHPAPLVARIKGLILFCGVKPKVVAARSGISLYTIHDWMSRKKRAEVEPEKCGHVLLDALKIVGDEK